MLATAENICRQQAIDKAWTSCGYQPDDVSRIIGYATYLITDEAKRHDRILRVFDTHVIKDGRQVPNPESALMRVQAVAS